MFQMLVAEGDAKTRQSVAKLQEAGLRLGQADRISERTIATGAYAQSLSKIVRPQGLEPGDEMQLREDTVVQHVRKFQLERDPNDLK